MGSSRKITDGRPTRLAARSSRRRMPPEYVLAGRSAASVRSKSASSSAARRFASRERRSSSRPISTRFSVPVRSSSTAAYCPVSPTSRRTRPASETTSRPPTRALPPSGRSSVASTRTAVVLPAPFGPSTPSTVPGRTARSTPARAVVSPNRFTRPSASIAYMWLSLLVGYEVRPGSCQPPHRRLTAPDRSCQELSAGSNPQVRRPREHQERRRAPVAGGAARPGPTSSTGRAASSPPAAAPPGPASRR